MYDCKNCVCWQLTEMLFYLILHQQLFNSNGIQSLYWTRSKSLVFPLWFSPYLSQVIFFFPRRTTFQRCSVIPYTSAIFSRETLTLRNFFRKKSKSSQIRIRAAPTPCACATSRLRRPPKLPYFLTLNMAQEKYFFTKLNTG